MESREVKTKYSMSHEFDNLVSYTLEKYLGSSVVSYKGNSKTPYKNKICTYYASADYFPVNMNFANALTPFGESYLEDNSLNGSLGQSGKILLMVQFNVLLQVVLPMLNLLSTRNTCHI